MSRVLFCLLKKITLITKLVNIPRNIIMQDADKSI
jgi:hypothetical protein